MRYMVICTKVYNGTMEVEAESKEQALGIAQENIENAEWQLGEATADYVE